jgi:hypothetical protein
MKVRVSLAHLLPVLACLSLCACNSQTYVGSDGKTTVTANAAGSEVKVNGANGENLTMNTGDNAKYPSSLPMPQYPGSKIGLSMTGSGPSNMANVTLTSTDASEKIGEFYKGWFNSNGWKIGAEATINGMYSLTAEKDNQTSTIMAMPGENGAKTIQLVVSQK